MIALEERVKIAKQRRLTYVPCAACAHAADPARSPITCQAEQLGSLGLESVRAIHARSPQQTLCGADGEWFDPIVK